MQDNRNIRQTKENLSLNLQKISDDYSLVFMSQTIELNAVIINVYPLDDAVMVVFETADEKWILRGVVKAELAQIEALTGKPIKITFEVAEARELVSVSRIEVIK